MFNVTIFECHKQMRALAAQVLAVGNALVEKGILTREDLDRALAKAETELDQLLAQRDEDFLAKREGDDR